jgi:hypothetical protein
MYTQHIYIYIIYMLERKKKKKASKQAGREEKRKKETVHECPGDQGPHTCTHPCAIPEHLNTALCQSLN